MTLRAALPLLVALGLGLSACGGSNEGALPVAYIDSEANLFASGNRLSSGGQHVRAATRSGLVALNRDGDVVPALADRWNVTDGGSIFVFRLREGTWPDGGELSADSVRRALERAIRELRGTSLGLDLTPIEDIRAMAGRVVEIRLASPMPDLLQLLAQPELGLVSGEGETGPMVLERSDAGTVLSFRPPAERGLPEDERWEEFVRDLDLHAMPAAEAIEQFEAGKLEVVLGGRLASLPLVDTGPLSRGTVRVDPAIGLFGLQVLRARGILADPVTREAVSMAIDRTELAGVLNIGGWSPTTRVVAPGLAEDAGLIGERWRDADIEDRRAVATGRIAAWRAAQGDENPSDGLTLSIAIADAPGNNLLMNELSRQLATIGVAVARAESEETADLQLLDRVARYAAPIWFLNQFNCVLGRGLCSEEADVIAAQLLDESDPLARSRLLADAEAQLTTANVYIPFGSPIRWSLVRGNVEGFAGNRWGFHPLPELAVMPR